MDLNEKREKLLLLLKTQSNDYFARHEDELIDVIRERYSEEMGLGSVEPERIYEMLMTNYIANLYDDIRWAAEEIGEIDDCLED